MPMIPEAVIAMLAWGRIGAVHSVVFGGFAANELASRIDDSKAKIIVSASCGYEPGRVVEYKPLLNKALELSKHKPDKFIIFQRDKSLFFAASNTSSTLWFLGITKGLTDFIKLIYFSGVLLFSFNLFQQERQQ